MSKKKSFFRAVPVPVCAAAFNAPLAGLMFVLEEVHHNFSPLLAITTFSSALVANFVSLNIFGLTPALDIGMMNTIPIA